MASELEKTQEEDNKLYIQMSKKNIDKFIDYFDYRKAFTLLILVLERLNENDKVEFIDYYSKKLNELYFIGGDSQLEARILSTK
jgi:hypothetical protein